MSVASGNVGRRAREHTFLTWNRGCFVDGESTSIGAFSAMFAYVSELR